MLRIIRQVEGVPKTFLQHMEDTEGLYEIRVEYGSNIFRIFCCFDEGNLVISYISRLENGKCDIQLSTLFKIFDPGLEDKYG